MNRHIFLRTAALGAASLVVSRWTWDDEPLETKTFTYKTAGGCEIKLDAIGSDPKVRKPAIVHIHGGALMIGSRKGVPPWLNPHGDHVVISIDYRLAPGNEIPGDHRRRAGPWCRIFQQATRRWARMPMVWLWPKHVT